MEVNLSYSKNQGVTNLCIVSPVKHKLLSTENLFYRFTNAEQSNTMDEPQATCFKGKILCDS